MSSPTWLGQVLTHPITLHALQKTITASIIGFTAPNSILRPACLPIQLILASLVCSTTALDGLNSAVRFSITLCVKGVIFQECVAYLDQAVLSRWTFEAKGPTAFFPPTERKTTPHSNGKIQQQASGSARARFLFGLSVSCDRRLLNTPWEVKNCPRFSSKDKDYVPSRSRFLLKATTVFVACCLFFDFVSVASAMHQPVLSDFAPDKVPFFTRLDEVTAGEFVTRLIVSLMHWVGGYFFLQAAYYSAAIPSVLLGGEVRGWRPAFGRLSELYSIRKFWGTVWHQFLRHNFATPAGFLAHSVLRLPSRGLVQRYIKLFLVFLFSGLVHLVIEVKAEVGIRLRDSGALRFFLMQAVGIVIEDAVQAGWRRVSGGGGRSGAVWKKVVGAVWVVVFLAWSTPCWGFPYVIHNDPGADRPLPFSVAAMLLGRR
ncbi:membrane bound O-acyl transferase family-domain-containing protein [Coniochaeta sp. 2T2.1]|nr:membrane bound O-acyl transferase family-domain-containing protein [Coniochaeta sp. 2T2.1]